MKESVAHRKNIEFQNLSVERWSSGNYCGNTIVSQNFLDHGSKIHTSTEHDQIGYERPYIEIAANFHTSAGLHGV